MVPVEVKRKVVDEKSVVILVAVEELCVLGNAVAFQVAVEVVHGLVFVVEVVQGLVFVVDVVHGLVFVVEVVHGLVFVLRGRR